MRQYRKNKRFCGECLIYISSMLHFKSLWAEPWQNPGERELHESSVPGQKPHLDIQMELHL